MRKFGKRWWIILLLLCMPVYIHGAKFGIIHLKAIGVETSTADVVAELIASDLANNGQTVLKPEAMDAAAGEVLSCYESGCAAEAGFKAKVEQVIYGSVSRLGEKHIVQVSVVNVSTQEVIWSGSLAASTAEDLDTVAKRLAQSIAEGKKPEATAEVGMVTEEEEEAPKQRRIFHTVGVKTGMLQPTSGYGDAGLMYHVGVLYWYETPRLVAELSAYTTFSGNLGNMNGTANEAIAPEISLLYMFSKKDISPYAGGGIGFGILSINPASYSVESAYGMALNGGGGIVFFRTYDIRILIDVRYRVNMSQVQGFTGPHQGIMLSIGFTYRPKYRLCGAGCL